MTHPLRGGRVQVLGSVVCGCVESGSEPCKVSSPSLSYGKSGAPGVASGKESERG